MKADEAMIDEFCRTLENASLQNVRNHRYTIMKFAMFLKKKRRSLLKATVQNVRAFEIWLLRGDHHHRAKKENEFTTDNRLRILVRFYEHLITLGILDSNPALSVLRGVKPFPTRERSRWILAACGRSDVGIRDGAFVEFLAGTGLRPYELRLLNLSDLAPDFKTVKYRYRVIRISLRIRTALKKYLEGVRPRYLRDSKEKALFITLDGGHRMGDGAATVIHHRMEKIVGRKIRNLFERLGV